jgi:hypothetical protein
MGKPFFDETQVRLIRRWLSIGEKTPREIAAETGCAVETIRRIGRRDTWNRMPVSRLERPKEEQDKALQESLAILEGMIKGEPKNGGNGK